MAPPKHTVCVYGGGGREHSLCWKLARSPGVSQVYCYPGNGGSPAEPVRTREGVAPICRLPHLEKEGSISPDGPFTALFEALEKSNVDLFVVGPEAPLAAGICDDLQQYNKLKETNIRAFGPSKQAAELEWSKIYSKDFLHRNGISTPRYRKFRSLGQLEEAVRYINSFNWPPPTSSRFPPVVVKASGLAAGKGVFLPSTAIEAASAVRECLGGTSFNGNEAVVEERIEGTEISLLAICSGKDYLILPPCRDYKRAWDDEKGPNTGGVGAVCPNPVMTPDLLKQIERKIVVPTLTGMKNEGRPFRGCLYAGLMITKEEQLYVFEYNCRLGDPEAQAIMPCIPHIDLYKVLSYAVNDKLPEYISDCNNGSRLIRPHGTFSVAVVVCSGGYPGPFEKDKEVTGVEEEPAVPAGRRELPECRERGVVIYHAGTKREGGKIITTGGRAFTVVGWGECLEEARVLAYSRVNRIKFDKSFARKDIGSNFPDINGGYRS